MIPGAGRARLERNLISILIAAAILAAFSPVLLDGVLHWDDLFFVGKDARLGWGWEGLRWSFGEVHLGQYVPLACLSFVADFKLWGGEAGGYHLTNLLWHVAAGLVWFGFWRRLLLLEAPARKGDAALAAAAAALLFCLHPLRVESVAWIAERRDMLCGFFYAAALRLYLEHCLSADKAGRRLVGALACFVLSLLSKAAGISLPATLLVLDVYPLKRLPADPRRWLGRSERAVLLEKAPFVALSAADAVGTLVALRRKGIIDGFAALSLSHRLTCAAYSLLFYVRKELWPFPMLPFYPMPRHFDPAAPRFLAWSAAAVVAALAVWRFGRKRLVVRAAAVHYAVALLPVSGLVSGGIPHLGSDRFSYFPSLAFSALAAAGLFGALARPKRRAVALAVTAAVLAVLGASSWRRCLEWRDDESFWGAALVDEPGFVTAYLNLARVYSEDGRLGRAAVLAEEAAYSNPENAVAWSDIGAVRLALAQWARAEEAYRKSVALDSGNSAARRGLARALEARGLGEAAAGQLRAAAALEPRDAAVRYELGNALFRLGRMDSAGDSFLEASRLDPKLASAHANLGRVLELQGLPDAAVVEYRAAVRIGGSPEALYNWANVESGRGRGEMAIRLYREALRLNPAFDDARLNWGNALARLGRFQEAAAQYRLLLARSPGNARAAEYLMRVSGALPR